MRSISYAVVRKLEFWIWCLYSNMRCPHSDRKNGLRTWYCIILRSFGGEGCVVCVIYSLCAAYSGTIDYTINTFFVTISSSWARIRWHWVYLRGSCKIWVKVYFCYSSGWTCCSVIRSSFTITLCVAWVILIVNLGDGLIIKIYLNHNFRIATVKGNHCCAFKVAHILKTTCSICNIYRDS